MLKVLNGSIDLYMNKKPSHKGVNECVKLKRAHTHLQKRLKNSCFLALKHCNSNMDLHYNENQSCLAIWEEIKDVASLIEDIETQILLEENDSL